MLKLADIFQNKSKKLDYSKSELMQLKLKKSFIVAMSTRLGLSYLVDGKTQENLCFVTSPDLRSSYRTYFTKAEIIRYLALVLDSDSFNLQRDTVPFPKLNELNTLETKSFNQ